MFAEMPLVAGAHLMSNDPTELLLNRTWYVPSRHTALYLLCISILHFCLLCISVPLICSPPGDPPCRTRELMCGGSGCLHSSLSLSLVSCQGIPAIRNAGNVLRAQTSLLLSFRLPPTLKPDVAKVKLTDIRLGHLDTRQIKTTQLDTNDQTRSF
jgi:hypothetical protein